MSESFPTDLRYTKDHEWTKRTGAEVSVGITAFAVEQLGDIPLVNPDVKAGDPVTPGRAAPEGPALTSEDIRGVGPWSVVSSQGFWGGSRSSRRSSSRAPTGTT